MYDIISTPPIEFSTIIHGIALKYFCFINKYLQPRGQSVVPYLVESESRVQEKLGPKK